MPSLTIAYNSPILRMLTVSCNQCTEMEVVDKGHCLTNFLSSAKKLFMIIEGAVITDFVGRHCRRRGYPCCRGALFVILPRKRGYTEYRRIFEKIIFLRFSQIFSISHRRWIGGRQDQRDVYKIPQNV